MRFDIVTLFPSMFEGPFGESIIKRARENGLIDIHFTNIRDYAEGSYRKVDDAPYGGGPGMVLMCEPIFKAVDDLQSQGCPADEIVLMTPQGDKFCQETAVQFSRKNRIILIAGHYEGFDERIRTELATMELSIGDFVLSGGELPAMTIVDAVTRLTPGALGDDNSSVEESFSNGLLEYPQYTRPADFRGRKVPDILLSGNHAEIEKWRHNQRLIRTKQRRPDLFNDNDNLK